MATTNTAKSTRRQVTAFAVTFKTKPDYRKDRANLEHEIVIPAPDGYVWGSSLVHELVICGADGTSWAALYRDALERMDQGIERCDDAACDICHPLHTEQTPSVDDWVKAEQRASRRRTCTFCGEPGHMFKTCPKYLRRHLGQA